MLVTAARVADIECYAMLWCSFCCDWEVFYFIHLTSRVPTAASRAVN